MIAPKAKGPWKKEKMNLKENNSRCSSANIRNRNGEYAPWSQKYEAGSILPFCYQETLTFREQETRGQTDKQFFIIHDANKQTLPASPHKKLIFFPRNAFLDDWYTSLTAFTRLSLYSPFLYMVSISRRNKNAIPRKQKTIMFPGGENINLIKIVVDSHWMEQSCCHPIAHCK